MRTSHHWRPRVKNECDHMANILSISIEVTCCSQSSSCNADYLSFCMYTPWKCEGIPYDRLFPPKRGFLKIPKYTPLIPYRVIKKLLDIVHVLGRVLMFIDHPLGRSIHMIEIKSKITNNKTYTSIPPLSIVIHRCIFNRTARMEMVF